MKVTKPLRKEPNRGRRRSLFGIPALLLSPVVAAVDAKVSTPSSTRNLKLELHRLVSNAKEVLTGATAPPSNRSKEIDENNDGLGDEVWSLTTTIKELITQYQEILDLQIQQSALIDEVNVFQMQRFINSLQELSDKYAEKQSAKTKGNPTEKSSYITIDKFEEMLSPESLLLDCEKELFEFIQTSVTNDKIHSVKEQVSNAWNNIINTRRKLTEPEEWNDSDDCFITGYDAAQTIQTELNKYRNDYIGVKDVCQDGASIVHEMTSSTYHGTGKQRTKPEVTPALGTASWTRYIPQDWEVYLLPYGWEAWPDPTTYFTQYANQWLRALGLASTVNHDKLIPYAGILTNNLNAIPETILDPNTSPGSCWPMLGNNGQITIRLPYPVTHVSGITVDHVSTLNVMDAKHTMQSAPKLINVYGYTTCNIKDPTCSGLGFDLKSKRLLTVAPITYDINHAVGKTTSAQTFTFKIKSADLPSVSNQGPPTAGTDGGLDEFADDDDPTSCSPTKRSCKSFSTPNEVPSRDSIAALSIEILNNWGNEDYTCLYRIRVHNESLPSQVNL